MRILAPFDGVAGIRLANVGDYVKDGAEIVMLEDLSALFVDFRLPERALPRLRTGQDVELTLDAIPGKTMSARVVALDAQVDANGRSLLVRANLANPQGQLRGGMFARVRTVFSTRDKALVVPEEALVLAGDRQMVFKVVDSEAGAKIAQRQPIKIGARMPGKAEVLDGLKEGDVIVVAGQARLMQGNNQPVRVVDLSRREGGAGGPPGAGGAEKSGGARPAETPGAGAPAAAAPPGGAGSAKAPGGPAGGSGGGAPAAAGAPSASTPGGTGPKAPGSGS
jgi:membrane fusion protein (multidrug efflux system)